MSMMNLPQRRFDFSYDPESQSGQGQGQGSTHPPSSSSTRYLKRLIARRGRWILGVTLGVGMVLYLAGPGVGMKRRVGGGVGWAQGQGDDIWKEGSVVDEVGGGWFGKGKGVVVHHDSILEDEDVVDGPKGGKGNETWYPGYIPPLHPNVNLLPPPSSLFTEVNLPMFLRPPDYTPFPETRLREIISPNPPEEPEAYGHVELSGTSFARNWEGKAVWDEPRGEMRNVQVGKFERESEEEKKVREERRDAVRRGFAWAWQGYKDYAWGE
jgi:mannosyl-oligosaccharide alpha-1,2-mannosidase